MQSKPQACPPSPNNTTIRITGLQVLHDEAYQDEHRDRRRNKPPDKAPQYYLAELAIAQFRDDILIRERLYDSNDYSNKKRDSAAAVSRMDYRRRRSLKFRAKQREWRDKVF